MTRGTLILGHRGAPYDAPENTLRAFALAMEQGADGVELDVQLSADGVPVVIHDATLERTTDGRGEVAAHPVEALRRVRSAGEPVPTLAEAVEWARKADAFLNVEIKAPGAAAASVRAVREGGWMERTLFSSFDADTVAQVGRLAAEARRSLLSETWDAAVLAEARRVEARGICLGVDAATAEALDGLRAERLPVVVWTADDPRRVRELLDAGVEAVITNRPAVAVHAARGG